MKLGNPSDTKVSGSEDFESHDFRVSDEHSAHIFRLLTNYSDPIGSLVRELTTNCFDAHEKAEVDRDVIVRMNRGDSILSGEDAQIQFEDFGTGLTPEEVKEIYTVIGESTKRDNNQEMGAFGIGAKSPCGYIRENDLGAYSVDTYVDGTHWQYSIAEDAEDGPQMTKIIEEPTDRENGTIVTVPIDSGDFYNFRRAIRKELAYFDNITFQVDNITNDYKIYRGENFIYRPDNQPYDEIHACFGKVAYPLDYDKLEWASTYIEKKKLNAPIALHFDIGEIQVVPNREQLNYTKDTIEAIDEKLEAAQKEFQEMWNESHDDVDSIEDLLEARESAKGNQIQVTEDISIPYCEKLLEDPDIKMEGFEEFNLPDNIFYNYKVHKKVDQDGYVVSNGHLPSVKDAIQQDNREVFFVEDKYSPKTNRFIASRFGRDLSTYFFLLKEKSRKPVKGKYIIDDPAEEDWDPDNPMEGEKPPINKCEKPEIHAARANYHKRWTQFDNTQYKEISEEKLKKIIKFENLVDNYVRDELDYYSDIEPTEDFEEWEKKKREAKEKKKPSSDKNETTFPIKILEEDSSGWGTSFDAKWKMDEMKYDNLNDSTLYIYGFQDDSDDLLDIAPIIFSNKNFESDKRYTDGPGRNKVAVLKIAMKREYLFEDLDNAMHISEFQKGHRIIDRAFHARYIKDNLNIGASNSGFYILKELFPKVIEKYNEVKKFSNRYCKYIDTTKDYGVQVSTNAKKNWRYSEDTIRCLNHSVEAINEQLPLVKNLNSRSFSSYRGSDFDWDEFMIYVNQKDLVHPKLWCKNEGIID